MELLSVSALNNFVYCKRLFYYREIEQIEAENFYLVDGAIKHKTVDASGWQIYHEGDKTYGMTLESARLGLIARFDVLEMEGGGRVPVEYKRGTCGEWLNHRIQLCAQGLLLEEHYEQKVDHGYIYYYGSKKRIRVELDEELRGQTLNALNDARQLLAEAICPEILTTSICGGCSLVEHCLPTETSKVNGIEEKQSKRVLTSVDEREILYITKSDVDIKKQSNRLIIKDDENMVSEIPLIKIHKLVLFGRVNLTHPVIGLLLENNIEIVYVNYYGKFEGTLIPPINKNGLLRKKQILASENEEQCLYLSRQFVRGKIHNMRTLLQRRNRSSKNQEIANQITKLKEILAGLEKVQTLDSLRGMEGLATRVYFQSLNELLSVEVEFEKRQRRPPKDPINSLLSLGYSLLTKDVESYCRLVGFDPYTGFLHKDRYGKPSLALDLMEEFRPLIVDQVVLYSLNSGIVSTDDFEEMGRLKPAGLKKFLAQYEQRKKTELAHPVFGYKAEYQRAIEIQARMLAKYLTGEIDEYIPLQSR